ncbi:MAG: hypothetical protein Q8Q08_12900 [Candidatus Omnitrophota bacterium]|nr:hypothetical protein [Candidatus Omnitrophota bacterium]
MADFADTLKSGQVAEDRVCAVLPTYGFMNPRKVGGYFLDWDIETDGGTTFEVKRDYKSLDTGNFFFEFEYEGRPSGIARTRADYFVLVVPRMAYVIRTEELRVTLREWCVRGWARIVGRAGNRGASRGVLLKCEHFTARHFLVKEWPLPPL